jgi:peptidoglycan hydrolase-like protein with peptidoglycan-binding domain
MGYAWPGNQPGVFLREGDTGNLVRQMQQALSSKGLNPGSADGVFGSQTKVAVIRLQKNGNGEHFSNIQGVVGPLTWSRLV